MNQKQIKAAVEAMLFAAGDPVSADKLAAAVPAALWAGTRLPQGRNASEQCVRNFRSFCQICNIL